MDMPLPSGDIKCYRCQSIKKCKLFLHASNLVYNKNLWHLQHFVSPEDDGMSIEICRDNVNVNITLWISVHNCWFVPINIRSYDLFNGFVGCSQYLGSVVNIGNVSSNILFSEIPSTGFQKQEKPVEISPHHNVHNDSPRKLMI
jgi:hypothetical protein